MFFIRHSPSGSFTHRDLQYRINIPPSVREVAFAVNTTSISVGLISLNKFRSKLNAVTSAEYCLLRPRGGDHGLDLPLGLLPRSLDDKGYREQNPADDQHDDHRGAASLVAVTVPDADADDDGQEDEEREDGTGVGKERGHGQLRKTWGSE